MLSLAAVTAQTSWKGTTSTAWGTAANWTAGVPTSTTDAIIGDANFTGANQPALTVSSVCKSLTLGTGTKASTLTVGKALTVSGNITIGANGTLSHTAALTISLTGNWTNSGAYNASNNKANVTFAGTTQTLGGSTATAFRKITVNTGSTTTLAVNISVANQLTVSGTLDPTTFTVSGAGKLVVNAGGRILVKASTFAGNYTTIGATTLNAGSIVEYAAASASQTVSNGFTYSTLRISGSGTRTLAGNLPALNSTVATAGNIDVAAGTLDLSTFTAARGTTAAGGTFTVANGATLKIGGVNSFPANYASRSLGSASTVEYSGTAQTISAEAYGNLTLSSSSGSVTKTFPATAMTIAGDLTSSVGAGTAVSFTATAALTVNGNVSLGAGTTFDGSSFSHAVAGNWTNNGTFTGSTSSLTLSGAGAIITGLGLNNFNNLTLTGAGITAATNTDLTVAGNFVTSGSGMFTHTPGGTGKVTLTGASKAITGTGINFNHLTVSGSISTADSVGIGGNLVTSGSLSASAGTITMSGAGSTISGAGTLALNALNVSGSVTTTSSFSLASDLSVSGSLSATAGTATFNGTSSLSGTANLFNVTLNGTKLALGSASVLGIAGTFVLTAGTFDVTTSVPNTVTYNAAGAQTALATIYDNLTFSGSGTKTNVAALTINRDLTVSSGVTFSAGPFTNTLSRNWVNNGTFTAGASTLALSGSLDATVSGATVFNALTVNKSSSANVVTVNTNITAATLNMTLGVMDTGTNVVTITSTRTGGGIIFGTITRTHTFTTAVAYAFEGTNNTVTFASASGVSSITMTVKPGAVSDFPFGGSVNRPYTAAVTASGAYNATLRLHYEDPELNGNDESTMQLWGYSGAWTASGKTANNTTNNWVEQSGLTNLAGRWTLSDNANVVRWNGSASTAWETAANWTAVQGSPSLPPSTNDITQLGSVSFVNQPTITSAVSVKAISFGSAQALTLTLGGGGSLKTVGNISGNWTNNVTHTVAVGAQTLTVGGGLSLGDGTNNHAINLTVSSGTVTVTGTLTETSGANVTFTGAGVLKIGGDFSYASGTFTPATSTVIYNSSGAQVVAPVTYNRLAFEKTGGTATLSSSATANSDLTLTNGGTFLASASLTVAGNAVIDTGTTLITGSGTTLSIGGNWTRVGTFTPGSATIVFNGSGAQTISAGTFNHFTFNKSGGTATLAGNLTINGDFTVNSGTLDLVSFTANRSAVGGTLTLASSTTLKISGTFPANFGARSLASSSTVEYAGTGAQTISAETYGHLLLSNGGSNAKTLAGATTVAGNLTINSSATLAASSMSLTAQGNWTNGGTFTAQTSSVTLGGANKNLSGATTFNNLTISGSYTAAGNVTVNGAMTVTGTFTTGSTTTTLAGNVANSGTFTSSGTVTFSGTGAQTISLNSGFSSTGTVNFNGTVAATFGGTSAPGLQNVNVNNTAGLAPNLGWTINGVLTVASGATFTGGAATHTFTGDFTNNGSVTSSGTLQFLPTNSVTLTLRGTSFSSSGTVVFGGTGQITLGGGAPSLTSVLIANTHAAGVTPSANWTLTGNLNISAGATLNGGSGLTHTISGSISDNGTLSGGTSIVVLNGTTEIGGIGITTFNHLTISGAVTNLANIAVSGNFTNNGAFDASGFDVTFTGSSASLIAGITTPTPIDSLVIAKTSATVTLAVNVNSLIALNISSGTLDTTTFTLTQDATLGGALTASAGGALKIGGANPLPTFTTYSFDPASTVEFSGASAQTIAAQNYGNLTSSSTGARTLASSGTIGISGAFTPGANSYTTTGSTIDFNGASAQTIPAFNFQNLTSSLTGARTLAASGTIGVAGTFTPGANTFTITGSTMNFNGAAQTIPAFTFHHLTTSGTLTKTLGGNITVNGALSLGAGSFADAGFIATVKGDLTSSVAHSGTGKIALSGGTTNHVVSGGGTFSTLELNDTNGALLSATNLTVTNLTLTAGAVTTSTNKVIIPTGGIVARTNGFVAGWLQKPLATGAPTVTFEVGGLTNYAPVSLLFSNVTVAGAVLARTVGTDHPEIANAPINPTKSANRYWTVTNVSGTFSSYRPTLNFTAGDLDALANPTNFLVGKLTSAVWTAPAIVTRTATNIQTASLTTFGDFQVGEVANVAPVAVGDVVTRAGGTSGFKVSPTDLLANDTDANGDPLTLISVTNRSVQGAAVELFGSWVFYTPTNAINVNDSFTYTISDGQGGTAVGTVSVNIVSPTQARQLTSVVAGSGSFYGVLNTAYAVQYVDDMASTNWLTLTNITTSASGLGQFTDPGPLPPQRFYRIAYP